MRNKVLGLVLATVLVVGSAVMAGCGGGSAAPASSKAASSAAPASSKAASSAAASSAAASSAASSIEVPLKFENKCGVDLHELYISGAGRNEWGNNLIEGGVLKDNMYLDAGNMIIDADNVKWDIKAVDENGDSVEFEGLDLSDCSTSGVTMTLAFNGDNFVVTAK